METDYTKPTTQIDDHINDNREAGHTVSVSENEDFVSVETVTRWGSRQVNIFRKTNGKMITSFDEMRNILHLIIMREPPLNQGLRGGDVSN